MIDKNVIEAHAEFIVDNFADAPPNYDVNLKMSKEVLKRFGSYLLDEVYEHIKHGDEEHKMWLATELEKLKKEL